jgi:hypothetical protein
MSPASARNRWLDWRPKAQILAETAENEPTKTTKTVSVVFVGAIPGGSPEIEVGPEPRPGPATDQADLLETRGVSWAEWKAAALNRLFLEQGVTGKPGRFTAATVRGGAK